MGRVWDVLALLVIAFVLYKLLVAPRSLREANAVPAPHVTYATFAGPPFVLTQHRGRVVFLDFWASWCEPCKASLPLVESYARKHPEVDVIAVDVGEPQSVVERYAREHDMQRVALDPQSLSSGFFVIQGFPTIVVIDPQGRVRATWTGFNPAVQLNMANAARTLAGTSTP
ncbi:MAG: TlpA family protein disulfide reductase [Vulcanimicrobiaceae bacterium]